MNWEKINGIVNNSLNKIGLSLKRYPGREQRKLISFLEKNNISHCIDIGANKGQFAKAMISMGYKGNISSFEPQTNAFELLKKASQKHENWKVYNHAIGDFNGQSEINISENSVSSSLLDILPEHTQSAPDSIYISKEIIEVKRLDSIYNDIVGNHFAFLKSDTQGFEINVLRGAEAILDKIVGIQLEMTCTPLYSNQILFDEMKAYIESKNFFLCSIENGFSNEETGRLLQLDAIFLKEKNMFGKSIA